MTQPDDHGMPAGKGRARYLIAALPLVLFGGLATVFMTQLQSGRDVSEIPSALLGTKAPDLELAALDGSERPALTTAAITGNLTLVNVFASWCVPCRQEHPMLLELSKDPRVNVVGINYKDRNDNALRFLGELGNPYAAIGVDPNGKAAIDWGVYGIPESYLVGPDGTILYKKVGPFDPESFETQLMPAIEKALAN
ncbi:MAG: DsbE family thiol:disulfide interchange protein [Pseudomonadota bacterium]|nr:DsbE family thiol:disulfide interchange protein [Pseudomonadota bacterium]